MVPSRLTWAAPRAAYGLMTVPTDGAAATWFSIAVIRARTGAARTPSGLVQTIVSWSPACPGNARPSRLSAVVDPVPGTVEELVYAEPAVRLSTPRITSSPSHATSTQARRRKHQRARAAMSVPYLEAVKSSDETLISHIWT